MWDWYRTTIYSLLPEPWSALLVAATIVIPATYTVGLMFAWYVEWAYQSHHTDPHAALSPFRRAWKAAIWPFGD